MHRQGTQGSVCVLQICPFFATRELTASADLVFMPYSYMVDSSVRKTLDNLSLKGSVVIFDEAHNVESVCSDAASFELTAGATPAPPTRCGLPWPE